jgi:hypothetical protein
MLTRQSVEQILRVIELISQRYGRGHIISKAYTDAVTQVASEYNVRYQTIGDACRRRLGLEEISEFVDLVQAWQVNGTEDLKKVIREAIDPRYSNIVDQFFVASQGNDQDDPLRGADIHEVEYTVKLGTVDARNLRALATLLGKDVEKIIPDLIRRGIRSGLEEHVASL